MCHVLSCHKAPQPPTSPHRTGRTCPGVHSGLRSPEDAAETAGALRAQGAACRPSASLTRTTRPPEPEEHLPSEREKPRGPRQEEGASSALEGRVTLSPGPRPARNRPRGRPGWAMEGAPAPGPGRGHPSTPATKTSLPLAACAPQKGDQTVRTSCTWCPEAAWHLTSLSSHSPTGDGSAWGPRAGLDSSVTGTRQTCDLHREPRASRRAPW